MAGTHLCLLLPESETQITPWSKINSDYLEYKELNEFLKDLKAALEGIVNENYIGEYDSGNISSFLKNIIVLDNEYPNPQSRILRNLLSNFNFNDIPHSELTNTLGEIFNQKVENHTLSYIGEKILNNNSDENWVLFNYHALTIQAGWIKFNHGNQCSEIPNVRTGESLYKWFIKNRLPKRKFHDTDKHRADNTGTWKNASPLLCSVAEAQKLLDSAVGSRILYNWDESHDKWIKFMPDNMNDSEGNKLYHGFHLDADSIEIPAVVRRKFNKQM